MKKTLDRIRSRLDTAMEKIKELENIATETSKIKLEKKNKTNK